MLDLQKDSILVLAVTTVDPMPKAFSKIVDFMIWFSVACPTDSVSVENSAGFEPKTPTCIMGLHFGTLRHGPTHMLGCILSLLG